MRILRRWDRWSRVAAVALVGAALLAGWAALEAWRVELPERTADGAGPALGVPADASPGRESPDSLVRVAVSAGPFRPDRSAPPERYRLPGEREADRPEPPATDMRLVGTALLPGQPALAAFRLSAGGSRVVRQGDEVEGYRVAAVEAGRVRLAGPDTSVVLLVAGPGKPGRRP